MDCKKWNAARTTATYVATCVIIFLSILSGAFWRGEGAAPSAAAFIGAPAAECGLGTAATDGSGDGFYGVLIGNNKKHQGHYLDAAAGGSRVWTTPSLPQQLDVTHGSDNHNYSCTGVLLREVTAGASVFPFLLALARALTAPLDVIDGKRERERERERERASCRVGEGASGGVAVRADDGVIHQVCCTPRVGDEPMMVSRTRVVHDGAAGA